MKRTLSAIAVLLCLSASVRAGGSILEDLTPKHLADLQAGKLAVIPVEVPESAWPKLQVYTLVRAPVSEIEEVFRDYKGATAYIPNLKAADILAHPSKDIYEVRYTSAMPIVGEATSIVRNVYSHDQEALVVSWNLIESTHAEISTGELRAEPHEGGAILRYTNYVKPKSALAGLVKFAALGEVKQTVSAIKKEVERRFGAK